MEEFVKIAGTLLGIIVAAIIIGLVFSYFIMVLWNACLVPAVTGVNEIGFLQAWGLSALLTLLLPRVHSYSK
jgi:hypothetical protein